MAIRDHDNDCNSTFDPEDYDGRDVIRRDVAVIGGGSSGTYGAISLGDMGKSVVLVERASRLGGHENSYKDPTTGINIDYGVQAYNNNSVVRAFFARFDIAITNYTFASGDTVYADFRTGQVLKNFEPSTNFTPYAQQLVKYPDLAWSWNIPNPIPKDLLLPLGTFVKKYGLEGLAFTLFSSPVGVANPPYLDQMTVNILRYTDEAYVGSLAPGGYVVTARHNNGELFAAAQAEMGSNVLLSSTVIATDRPSDESGVKLVVQTPHGRKLILASKMLVSIPLIVPNMAPFDLDDRELELFKRFHYSAYYTSIFRSTALAKQRYVNVGIDTKYHIPVLPGAYTITPTAVDGLFYFWYGSPHDVSRNEIQADMTAVIRRLSNSKDHSPEYVTFESHTPFKLEVSAEDIQNRFYDKLAALQGYRNTWYTGAAMLDHNSGALWNFTHALLPRIIGLT